MKKLNDEIKRLNENLLSEDVINKRQEAFILGKISGLLLSVEILEKHEKEKIELGHSCGCEKNG